ncbi:MAG TPA: hypothetical protein VGO96_07265 [Pyrinomonadaceae bacterium]|nr:hypothetical protein [Pyrinomonadaceae bacterium]
MQQHTNFHAVANSHVPSSAHPTRAFLFPLLLLPLLLCLPFFCATGAHAQSQRSRGAASATPTPSPATPQLTRSSTRHETRRFGYGGTLTIYGAPTGAITVEAWSRNEVDITAEIELKGGTEEELAALAAVNNFVLDEDGSHLTLMTTGTHDRKFMKRAAKNFPKNLLTLPWKIDYRIRVPAQVDLEIYAGRGALNIANTDGAISLNAGESEATFTLGGGDLVSTITGGSVALRIPVNSWRGRGASIRLGRGELTIELPASFNGDLDATVLRAGRIENNHPALAPREGVPSIARQLRARAGAGGATLTLEVGDGVIRINKVINAVTSDK